MDEASEIRFENIERRQNCLEEALDNHKKLINGKFDDINKKLDGRPSWGVVILITILSNTVVGFIVATVSRALVGG